MRVQEVESHDDTASLDAGPDLPALLLLLTISYPDIHWVTSVDEDGAPWGLITDASDDNLGGNFGVIVEAYRDRWRAADMLRGCETLVVGATPAEVVTRFNVAQRHGRGVEFIQKFGETIPVPNFGLRQDSQVFGDPIHHPDDAAAEHQSKIRVVAIRRPLAEGGSP